MFEAVERSYTCTMAAFSFVLMGMLVIAAVAIVLIAVVVGASKGSRAVLTASATVVGMLSQAINQRSSQQHVTFELEDGRRMVFALPGEIAGQLIVGDTGALMWRGTKFAGFQRQILR